MPAIGHVKLLSNGSYKGRLATLSIRREIQIIPVEKFNEAMPDFRVMADDVELGGGWKRQNRTNGNEYISLSLAAPEFGPRTIYANLGKKPDTKDEFALIWNQAD